MKNSIKHAVLVFAASLLLSGCASSPGRHTAWEYQLLAGRIETLQPKINSLADDGWEIMSVTPDKYDSAPGFSAVVTMRRPKR
jgi:hypothetical protein